MKLQLTVEEARILRAAIYTVRSELRMEIVRDPSAKKEFGVLDKLYNLIPEKELIIQTVDHN